MLQNKWFKLIIIFLAALDSYALINCIFTYFFNNLEILRIFVNYTGMLAAIILINIFVFNDKDILSKLGLIKKKLADSLLIAFIFLMIILSANFILFASHQKALFFYYPYFFKFLLDFSTSFSDLSLCFIFLVGVIIQIYAAFIDEFIFRGLMINTLAGKSRGSVLAAVLISALLFCLWHMDFSINGIFSKLVLGLLFGACFIASKRNVVGVGILHSLSNLWAPANIAYLFMLLFR